MGFHKYDRTQTISHAFRSHVYDMQRICRRCGFVKKWVKPKPERFLP